MLYHDMTNDYRERDFEITITLQEGNYTGEIYFKYHTGGATAHGLQLRTIEHIYYYLTHLGYAVDPLNHSGGFSLPNNCEFVIDEDNCNLHFVLHNVDGNRLEKTIPKFNLEQYIVSIAMTNCTGRGVKRNSRKCGICKNFQPIEGKSSGICTVRKRKVSQGTSICKYGFIQKE